MVRAALGVLDRECPRCGAAAGIKCRDVARPKRTAARPHIARGWLDRPCPTCRARPGERCSSPGGLEPDKPHIARWTQPRTAGLLYGYARVLPAEDGARAAEQHAALTAGGCVRVWTDTATTGLGQRGRELGQLLGYLQRRDVLVVWRLDRLASSISELAQIVGELRRREIALRSLGDGLDSTSPGGEQLFAAISALAALPQQVAAEQLSSDAHQARSNAGSRGRPALLDAAAHARVRAMRDAGEHTIEQIAAAHGVSRPTIYRSLQHTSASHKDL